MANMKSEKILMAAAMLPKINEFIAEFGYEVRDFSLYRPEPYEGCLYGAGIQLALEPKALYQHKPKEASRQDPVKLRYEKIALGLAGQPVYRFLLIKIDASPVMAIIAGAIEAIGTEK